MGRILATWLPTTAAAIAIASAVAGSAEADETLRFKVVGHSAGALTMDAGDGVEGHVIGAAKFVGMLLFEDGQAGTMTYVARFDYTKGSGTYDNYQTSVFPDGSILRLRSHGTAVADGNRTVFPDGVQEIVGGTGRFAGATGSGIFTGIRVVPLADGGDAVFDVVLEVKM